MFTLTECLIFPTPNPRERERWNMLVVANTVVELRYRNRCAMEMEMVLLLLPKMAPPTPHPTPTPSDLEHHDVHSVFPVHTMCQQIKKTEGISGTRQQNQRLLCISHPLSACSWKWKFRGFPKSKAFVFQRALVSFHVGRSFERLIVPHAPRFFGSWGATALFTREFLYFTLRHPKGNSLGRGRMLGAVRWAWRLVRAADVLHGILNRESPPFGHCSPRFWLFWFRLQLVEIDTVFMLI